MHNFFYLSVMCFLFSGSSPIVRRNVVHEELMVGTCVGHATLDIKYLATNVTGKCCLDKLQKSVTVFWPTFRNLHDGKSKCFGGRICAPGNRPANYFLQKGQLGKASRITGTINGDKKSGVITTLLPSSNFGERKASVCQRTIRTFLAWHQEVWFFTSFFK